MEKRKSDFVEESPENNNKHLSYKYRNTFQLYKTLTINFIIITRCPVPTRSTKPQNITAFCAEFEFATTGRSTSQLMLPKKYKSVFRTSRRYR